MQDVWPASLSSNTRSILCRVIIILIFRQERITFRRTDASDGLHLIFEPDVFRRISHTARHFYWLSVSPTAQTTVFTPAS